jgi:hypothetical protein
MDEIFFLRTLDACAAIKRQERLFFCLFLFCLFLLELRAGLGRPDGTEIPEGSLLGFQFTTVEVRPMGARRTDE